MISSLFSVSRLALMMSSLAFLILAQVGRAEMPDGWQDKDTGKAKGGSCTYAGGTFTLTGTGAGPSQQGDDIHLAFLPLPWGGNFRLTARLASFQGGAAAQAGLIAREPENSGSMAGVAYLPGRGAGLNPAFYNVLARDNEKGAIYPWTYGGVPASLQPPCYLQLVRHGNDFAVYKSSDGKFWSQVQQHSGGPFEAKGKIEVGMYVAGGGAGPVTATFDQVKLERNPVLPYESSWVGNTFSSDSTSYVSGGVEALYTAPDGTCYTESFWDEGGEVGKRYMDGRVLGPFGVAPEHGFEGSVAGDGKYLYFVGKPYAKESEIVRTDLTTNSNAEFRVLFAQTPLTNPKTGAFCVAGIAAANGEVYVSDAYTGQILVYDPTLPLYGVPQYAGNLTTDHAIDTSGVSGAAPQQVYQTSYQADNMGLTLPGLTPGSNYTVRLHFAETSPDYAAPGKRVMDLSVGGQKVANYDLFKTAGALDKAAVLAFNNVASDAQGVISITMHETNASAGAWGLISGVEVLKADGSPALRVNLGGGGVADWKPSIQERPDRAFKFTRPGPMVADKAGNLWIVQEGTTFPVPTNFKFTPGWAAIKCYDKNGNFMNKQITDVVNPAGVAYDAVHDRLLVADNGPEQNIRIYDLHSGTAGAPALSGTFGQKGGVLSGKTPGLLHDADAGGDARFLGPVGVGADAKGNIYVACDPGGTQSDLRAFSPEGKMLWHLSGLEMCNTGDFDPAAHASDVWTISHHYAMNYANTQAGSEWSLKAYAINPEASASFSEIQGGCNVEFRRIGKTPFLFTGEQGNIGTLRIFRFVGEQIVLCGSITAALVDNDWGLKFWQDKNGDGIQQPGEISNVDGTGPSGSYDVDQEGNLYVSLDVGGPRTRMDKFAFLGLDAHGAPTYSTKGQPNPPIPPPFDLKGLGIYRFRYLQGPIDTMYLLGRTSDGGPTRNGDYGGTLACYDHWSTQPVLRFKTVLPTPMSEPNFSGGKPPYSPDGFFYMAFDVANSVAFVSDLWGQIAVVDDKGNRVMNLIPGPEVSGLCAWEDEAMGVRAHYNPDLGEYDILQENSGFRARENFYRWRPAPGQLQ